MVGLQASQLRKSNYVPEKGVDYDPDKANSCTVYAGTVVQQVTPHPPCPCAMFVRQLHCRGLHVVHCVVLGCVALLCIAL